MMRKVYILLALMGAVSVQAQRMDAEAMSPSILIIALPM